MNDKVIRNQSLVNIFFIELRLDGYVPGTYNFTIYLNDESNHTVTDSVEVQIFTSIATKPKSSSPNGNFFQNIDPNILIGAGAFVAIAGGAFFMIKRRKTL